MASEILYISPSEKLAAFTHNKDGFWKLNELVCVKLPQDKTNPGKEIPPDCGWIITVTRLGAIVKFTESPSDIEKGWEIVRSETIPPLGYILAEEARRRAELDLWLELLPIYNLLFFGSLK